MNNVTNAVIDFVTSKWVHVFFVAVAAAAGPGLQAAGYNEPAWLDTVLTLGASGILTHAIASWLISNNKGVTK